MLLSREVKDGREESGSARRKENGTLKTSRKLKVEEVQTMLGTKSNRVYTITIISVL